MRLFTFLKHFDRSALTLVLGNGILFSDPNHLKGAAGHGVRREKVFDMNTMLQISLGLIPAILLVLGSLLLKRKKPLVRLIALALLVAISASCCVIHFVNRAEVAGHSKNQSAELVEMVYALLASGQTGEAEVFLDQLMQTNLYIPEYALCQARIHVLQGDYTAAKMMYQKALDAGLKGDDLQAEYDMVCRSLAPDGVDLSLLAHNPAYKQQTDGADQLIQDAQDAKQDAVKLVNDHLKQLMTDVSKHITDSVQSIQKSEELYKRYLADEIFDPSEVEAIIQQLDALEKKYPALMDQAVLREVRLKMQLTKGDFSAIAKSVTEKSGYKELMVLSELYINGYITEKDFSKAYGRENIAIVRQLREHLVQLYNNEYRQESIADRRKLKDYIDNLKFAIDNPALSQMQEDLKMYAQRYNAVDGSKIYMQLANLSYYQGNNSAANKHLSESFRVVGNCQDENFTGPMLAVMNAISNKQDTESLKQVTYLVSQIMQNSMVMDMHQAVRVPNPEQEVPEGEEPKPGFDTYVSDYASQKRASVNIVELDASGFEEVVLEICVDDGIAYSAQELKKLLQLTDCDAEIKDFTVEAITYDRVNIILVCDVSGSMDGSPIESLRQTVKKFIAGKSEKERIGLVTFSYYVEEVYGLDASVEELNAAADRLYASGGTAIYDAMCYAVTMVGADEDALNVILLMSDGQDNNPGSAEQINQNVCLPCVENGVVIYPIGLGYGVDSEYLARFATGTGGAYLYVNDDATLNNTYEYLHNLLSTRYRITYKAVDTMTNNREVRVSVAGDDLAYDLRQYSLGLEEAPTQQEAMADRFVTGLDTRVLFKTPGTQTVNLIVSGFREEDKVSVKLIGDLDFDLTCKRINESKYELILPSNVGVGVYDLQVKVNDGTVYLANELTVAMEETSIRFGSYTFTSYIRKSSDTATVLTGNVCMNGWLYFDSAITLRGNVETDSTVTLEDFEGSRILYGTDHATGFAKYLANKGAPVQLPALGRVVLYDDDYLTSGTENYTVSPIVLPVVYLARLFMFDGPTLYLYPDALKVEVVDVTTKFPFQEQLLTGVGVQEIFNFDVEGTLTLTKDTVGLYINVELDPEDYKEGNNNSTPVKTGNMPLSVGLDEFALTIDTLKNDYKVKFLAELNFMKVKGMGFSLAWSDSLLPKEARFYCDFNVNVNISGVPVTFSDFELGMKDIDTSKSPFYWTYEGATKISVAKVSAVLPGLEDYLDDAAVVSLSDTTLSLNLGNVYVKMSTEVKLFGEVKVGAAEIECGKIPYTNSLLNMRDTEVAGLRAKLTKGLFWNSHNCDIELSGSQELMLSSKVLGGTISGTCDVDVRWWIFSKSADLRGSAFVGMFMDHSGDLVFTVRATGRDGNKQRGINVSWSKEHGRDIDTKFY